MVRAGLVREAMVQAEILASLATQEPLELEMLGLEPETAGMQSRGSAIELDLLPAYPFVPWVCHIAAELCSCRCESGVL